MRQALISRETKETSITLNLNLDGLGQFEGSCGIGFFDHMLNSFSVHSGFDIVLSAKGDLNVDCHHTVEDIGIVMGKAFAKVLSDKGGLKRYGTFFIPMDEALARASVDVSGRPYLYFDASFSQDRVGEFDSCMVKEFFRAFVVNAGMTLHISLLYGENAHHEIEAIFKAVAHAVKEAVDFSDYEGELSSKGVLE